MNRFLAVGTVLALSLIAIWPLFSPGYFTIHDDQQVVRLFELTKTLQSGIFPARWVEDLGFGYGYALFNFYPPFVYYLGEVFHLIGFGFINSIKIVWAIALVGSGVTMYFLAREFFGKIGGVVAAIFYLYAPYHAVDAYVRGALAELFSFLWLPLIFLFSHQKKHVLTSVTLAGLMLTHNLVFLSFIGFYLLWSRNFLPLRLAAGLTAFFWLPSMAEKQYTLVDKFLTSGLASYQIHFVCVPQLWNSLWGYGGSVAGCLDGLSFKIGKPHLFLVGLALIISIWKRSMFIFGSVLMFLTSVFMTTRYSQIIWDNIPQLWYLQFPWRFLELAAFFSSLLAGSFTLVVSKNRLRLAVSIILVVSVIYLHAKYFSPSVFLPNATDKTALSEEKIKWRISQTSFEYMPKDISIVPTQEGSYVPNIVSFPRHKYIILSGGFRESESRFLPGKFLLSGKFYTSSIIQFQITNFPGWKILVDGQPVDINDANKIKLMTVKVAPGEHKINGYFTDTPVRVVGNVVSLASIIFLINYNSSDLWKKTKLSTEQFAGSSF